MFLCSSEVTLLPHLLGLKDDGVRGSRILCRKRKHFVSSVSFVVEMLVAVIDGGHAFVRRQTAAHTNNLAELSRSAQTIWLIKNTSLGKHHHNASRLKFTRLFF